MKPIYEHDCSKCMFLGSWEKPLVGGLSIHYDLYVCQAFTNVPSTNCVARYGNEGREYASMTLTDDLWDASLAAINGPRQSLYHCYMPELCECWRRWKERLVVVSEEKIPARPLGNPTKTVWNMLYGDDLDVDDVFENAATDAGWNDRTRWEVCLRFISSQEDSVKQEFCEFVDGLSDDECKT